MSEIVYLLYVISLLVFFIPKAQLSGRILVGLMEIGEIEIVGLQEDYHLNLSIR